MEVTFNYNEKRNDLNASIQTLKSEIQKMIDDRKNYITSNDKLEEYNNNKKNKIDLLKTLTIELKELHLKEKSSLQKINEYKNVSRQIDSIEFGAARKRNNDAMERAKKNKETREKASEEFYNFLRKEEEYNEIDSKIVPGKLFLHKDIINSYGMCSYINICDNEENQEQLSLTEFYENKRLEWLESQEDNGKIYFDLYEKIINKNELKQLEIEKVEIENEIDNLILNNLNDTQKNIYQDAISFIKEYNSFAIKTKRLKEKYKVFTNNLSIIQNECGLSINEYFTLKFNSDIYVNEFIEKQNTKNAMKMYNDTLFNEKIVIYKSILQKIEQKNKYVNNTLKNLKNDMFLFLSKKENKEDTDINIIKQVGKYYKKWSDLKNEEKLERLESFAKYYIDKKYTNDNILNKESEIEKLTELLKNEFTAKNITYKDLNWSIKKGVIDSIKNLEYNNDNKMFYVKKRLEENKRKSSSRSVVNKDTEKIINQEILGFVIKTLTENENTDIKNQKELCMEKIKNKLKLKKLSLNDKTLVYKKFDEIYYVVKNNQN